MRVTKEKFYEEYIQRMNQTFSLDPTIVISIVGPDLVRMEWEVYFNNASVKGLLKETGVNLLERNPNETELRDPEFLTTFVRWALTAKHPDITDEVIDEKILGVRLYPYILNQLTAAVTVFRPDMSDMEIEKEVVEEALDPTSQSTDAG